MLSYAVGSSYNNPVISTQIEEEMPFPGKGADFILDGDWDVDCTSTCALVRSLDFSSNTPDSFFRKMSVLGYRDGKIVLSVTFQRTQEEITRKYFTQKQLPISDVYSGFCRANSIEEKNKLFAILTRYNIIPEEHVDLINKLINAQSWYDITPLKPGEKLSEEKKQSLDAHLDTLAICNLGPIDLSYIKA